MEIQGNIVKAADGKYIHRVGSDCYFSECTLLQGETLESFEEVDSIPEPPTYDRDKEISDMIHERYSYDRELAIQRQRDTNPQAFKEYFDYCEYCKKVVDEKHLSHE